MTTVAMLYKLVTLSMARQCSYKLNNRNAIQSPPPSYPPTGMYVLVYDTVQLGLDTRTIHTKKILRFRFSIP